MAVATGLDEVRAATVGDDYLLPADRLVAERDLRYGQMAVVIHQAIAWPGGLFCRNCHARWPCPLYRWGRGVLTIAGWTPAAVQRMVERAADGDVPWT